MIYPPLLLQCLGFLAFGVAVIYMSIKSHKVDFKGIALGAFSIVFGSTIIFGMMTGRIQ